MNFRRYLWVFCALFSVTSNLFASTDAVVKHKATLRSDPSTKNAPILVLQAGEDVEVLDPTPVHRYYHVRVAEGTEGWVYSRNLEIVPTSTPAPASNPTPTPPAGPQPGISSTFSTTWDKPTPEPTTFEGPDGECGSTGDGGDTFTNLRKNRTDVPQSYHEVSWRALQSLPYPVAGTTYQDLSTFKASL